MHKYHHHYFFLHHLHVKRFMKNKYNDLLVADTMRELALSMISLFVPIYLFKIGLSLLSIALMELGLFVLSILFHYLIIKNMWRWGVKKPLIASYILNILFFFYLYGAPFLIEKAGIPVYLLFLSLFSSLVYALYWTAHHFYVFKSTKVSGRGSKIGLLLAVPALVAIIGPFFGSLVIDRFDFRLAFLVSALLLMTATAALFSTRDLKIKKSRLSIKGMLDLEHDRKNIILMLQGLDYAAVGFFWPILMFLLSIKLVAIGFFYFVSNILWASVCYYSGRQTDKKGNRRLVQLGSIGHAVSVVGRAFSRAMPTAMIFQALGGVFGAYLNVPIDSGFYRYNNKNYDNGLMNREFYMHCGRSLLVGIFIIYLLLMPPVAALSAILATAAVGILLIGFVARKDNSIIN